MKVFEKHYSYNPHIFISATFIVILASANFTFLTDESYTLHSARGKLILNGSDDSFSSFPMWGFSFLAFIFGKHTVFAQSIILFLSLTHWRLSLEKIISDTPKNAQLTSDRSELLKVFILIPYILLCTSSHNNGICYILLFSGIWYLYLSIIQNKHVSSCIISGALIGLSYNFRTEVFLFLPLLICSIIMFRLKSTTMLKSAKQALVLSVSFMTFMMPYQIYHISKFKEPSIFTSNGGGVLFLGLGLLKENPWGIEPTDEFVEKIAIKNEMESPWSNEANLFFKKLFFQSVFDEPSAFAKRFFYGSTLIFTQGLYFPDLRFIFSRSAKEYLALDAYNEKIKQRLKLNYNRQQAKYYTELVVSNFQISTSGYLIILSE